MKLGNVICGATLVVFCLHPFLQAQSVSASTPHNLSERTQVMSAGADSVNESSETLVALYSNGESDSPQQPGPQSTNNVISGDVPVNPTRPAPPAAASSTKSGFFPRFFKAYRDDWFPPPTSGPEVEVPHRGYPAVVDGPPFPFSDWPYGGSPVIGASWTQSGPLMQALWAGPHGDAWKKSGVQIYGWINGGFNVSTSDKPGYANFPTAYAEKPNSIQPDQEVLYIERQPNTVQTDHFD